MNISDIPKEVFKIQSKEILNLSKLLTKDFEQCVIEIHKCIGKVIVCGIGKSGIVGKKISATLSSTGTPSFFIHPSEAVHGDLGMIQKQDVVILISNSGETDEVLKILPFLLNQKNTIISITGNPNSTIAKNSKFKLNISVQIEACPFQLAPTSSTTATMVMGDAIAIALMKIRNFRDIDFQKFHPSGSLGKRLLQKVGDVMKKDELPIVNLNDNISEVIYKISRGKCGIAVVLKKGKVVGVISDGDIRRIIEKKESTFFQLKASCIMNENPCTIVEGEKLNIAENLMNARKINSLIVTNDNAKFIGIIQIYDL